MAAPSVSNSNNTADKRHNQQQQQTTADSHQHNFYAQSNLQGQYGSDETPTFAAGEQHFVPNAKPNSSMNRPQVGAVQQQQQKQQPEFVVFELFGQRNQQQQQQQNQQNNHQQLLLNVQQKFNNRWAPFSPLLSSRAETATAPTFNTEQLKRDEGQTDVESAVASASPSSLTGICFATVHLWHDNPTMALNNSSSSSSSNTVSKHRTLTHQQRTTTMRTAGHLLFDNPMFRRLPNWHFFGDDRRLMPIPPLIPLLPVLPIERTLLYIAPNESSSRQPLLLAMLDMKRKTEIAGGVPAIGDTSALTETELLQHQQEDELLPTVEQECPSSTSGVESMSSAEESSAMTERSSRSTTPTNKVGQSTQAEDEQTEAHTGDEHQFCDGDEQQNGGNDGRAEEEDVLLMVDQQHHFSRQSPTSSATESCTSSTPNSPPTFDRRIVRMSRGTRDAVRRLSRRFEEEKEEGEENGSTYAAEDIIEEHGFDKDGFVKSQDRTKDAKRSSINSDEAISRMDVLSERIRDFHYNEDQTHAQLNRKLQLRDQLYYAISPIFPMCGLYIVGSSLNGFGTKRSDLDLCLMITNRDIDQRTDAVVVLSSVMRTLENNQIVAEQNLILAKVPILRIKFVGTFHDITVDLNVNNSVAIRNTHLMCYYSSFDWRVRPLVMVVKEWAKRRGINDSACSTFTSYSLVLLVIHYLQCGAQPPVLPNLQQMYPKRFNVRADVRTLNVSLPFEPIPTAMGWQFKDDATLSELLLGFLRYYAFQFDFDADAISIRMGKKVNRAQVAQNQSPFNTLSQWHCICIEEPFTLSNTAHSVYDERIFQEIKKTFVDSYRELDKHRDLDRFLAPLVVPSTSSATAPKK